MQACLALRLAPVRVVHNLTDAYEPRTSALQRLPYARHGEGCSESPRLSESKRWNISWQCDSKSSEGPLSSEKKIRQLREMLWDL